MALSLTFPVSAINDTANDGPYTFGAFTPTADSLLVVMVWLSDDNADATISGGGLTWTNRELKSRGLNPGTHYLWTAPVGGSPSSTTITISSPLGCSGCFAVVAQFTGQHASSPIVQTKSGDGNSSNPSLTLSQAMNTNNTYLIGVEREANPAAVTQPTSWTEQLDVGHNNPATGYEAAYRAGGETGSTVTTTAASASWSMLFIEIAPGGTAYTLTAAAGSFAETGNAATLKAALKLTAAKGTFTETANAALLRWGRTLSCVKGTFTLTGIAATLGSGQKLVAAVRALTLTMNGAWLTAARRLTAGVGAFVESGQAATLRLGKGIVHAVAPYVLTGKPATLKATFKLTAAKGTFTETGNAAGLRYPYRIACSAGSFSESGKPATLKAAFKLTAAKGTFSETANAAGLQKTFPLACAKGTFVLTGKPAGSIHTFRLDARPGRFVIVAPSNLHPEAGFVLQATGGCILRDTGGGFVLRNTGGFVIRP